MKISFINQNQFHSFIHNPMRDIQRCLVRAIADAYVKHYVNYMKR